jgi:hypothetical protein
MRCAFSSSLASPNSTPMLERSTCRHTGEREHVVFCKIRNAREQHRKQSQIAVRGLGQPFSQGREPFLKQRTKHVHEPIAGKQLQQNRRRHEREPQAGPPADAGQHVHDGDRKSEERQQYDQDEYNRPVHLRGALVDIVHVDLRGKNGHADAEQHSQSDPAPNAFVASSLSYPGGHRNADPSEQLQFFGFFRCRGVGSVDGEGLTTNAH